MSPRGVDGEAVEAFWRRTEAAVRSAIREIPDGTYEASSFLDDDGIRIGQALPITPSAFDFKQQADADSM